MEEEAEQMYKTNGMGTLIKYGPLNQYDRHSSELTEIETTCSGLHRYKGDEDRELRIGHVHKHLQLT